MTTFVTDSSMLVHLIGDPHLGKNFDENTKAARKGERSVHQMAQFNAELRTEADVIVMVGDLFDNPYVADSVVVAASSAVLSAAEDNPDTTYLMMAGNHDRPRNLSAIGAWISFVKQIEDRLPNLHAISRPNVFSGLALFPWEWDKTAEQQVLDLAQDVDASDCEVAAAVGHWDLQQFGDKITGHLAPIETLRWAFGGVPLYSGHYHEPGMYGEVMCTGSMQPISHGEDPEEKFYVTRALADVLADPDKYRDKHVRVIVRPGEEIPDINCLGLTHLRIRGDDDISQVTASLGEFDWHQKLRARIGKLAQPVRDFIIERMPDAAPTEQRGGSSSPLVPREADEPAGADGGFESTTV